MSLRLTKFILLSKLTNRLSVSEKLTSFVPSTYRSLSGGAHFNFYSSFSSSSLLKSKFVEQVTKTIFIN